MLIVCTTTNIVHAQTPNTATQPGAGTQPVATKPAAYSTGTAINAVYNWEPNKPLTLETDVTDVSRTLNEVKKTTAFFDGIGRPLQTVLKAASPAGYDMVTPVVYDALGRETYRYMPYTSSTGNDGNFKSDPFAEQETVLSNFYNPGADPAGEKYFYSKTDFEASPLDRPQKIYGPGNSWVGDAVGITADYQVNTRTEGGRIWNIDLSATGTVPNTSATYTDAMLYKNISTDEKGMQVIEYINKQGQLVLKKVQVSSSPGNNHTGWMCTYYVYDDAGRLRFVIPPKATDYFNSNGWAFESSTWSGSTIARELCYSYEYDDNKRMIIKRIPGAGETYMVYDARDRLIMTQDENMRTSGAWLVTVYDNLNRPVKTGLLTDKNTRAYHQANADNSNSYPVTAGTNFEELTTAFYDDYTWVAANGSPVIKTLNTSNVNNTTYFYTPDNTTFPYPQPVSANYQTTNIITGTKVKVLGTTATYLWTVHFYDNRGRLIQTQSTNLTGGKQTVTTQYSFTGQVLRVYTTHTYTDGSTLYKIGVKNEYDGTGRLLKTYQKTQNGREVTIAQNEYDEAGQLKQKSLGLQRRNINTTAYKTTPLDIMKYEYNIRGWLRGINKDYSRGASPSPEGGQWFGEEICYDYGFTNMELNGNIAGIIWKSGSDGEQRAYAFTYDNANRLTKANFTQYTGTAWNVSKGIDYSLTGMTYDLNGNILTLSQNALGLNSSGPVDALHYIYHTNSNRLYAVYDDVLDDGSKTGDFREGEDNRSDNITGTYDYLYDANGNLVKDGNKFISSITYNYLNLSGKITVMDKGTVTYTYDAAGNKLRKVTVDNMAKPAKTTITDYSGIFTYENEEPQFIATAEGRVRPITINGNAGCAYDYMEKDHLGNVRAVITDELKEDPYPNASLESANIADEKSYYSGLDNGVVNRTSVSDYPANDTYTNPNDYIQKLRGNATKIGAGIFLKVMAGDKLNVHVSSWYNLGTANPANTSSALTDIVAALTAGIPGASGSKVTQAQLTGTVLNPTATNFLTTRNTSLNTANPRAWLNIMVFDEQMNLVDTKDGKNTYYQQVANSKTSTVQPIDVVQRAITKSGYVYIYVSNESTDVDVYFDNLQVTHIRSALVETNDYTPWGLVMKGVSSRALSYGGAENKKKFNNGSELQNKEFIDGSGLETYITQLRMLDPQLGRWWQIDPKPDYAVSLYSAMNNNPILINDPLGDTIRIQFRTGFLGLGKKQEVIYNKGNLTNKDGSAYTGKVKGYLAKVNDALSSLNNTSEGEAMVNELQNSSNNFTIRNGSVNSFIPSNAIAAYGNIPSLQNVSNVPLPANGSGGTIVWNPKIKTSGMNTAGDTYRPAYIGLGHEMAHGRDANEGVLYVSYDYTNPLNGNTYQAQHLGLNKSEWRAVYYENIMRGQAGIPLRINYGLQDNEGSYTGVGPTMLTSTGQPINYPIQ